MARIRSVHPSQWTDEAFATLSPLAHLLAIGLRNEADDGGVFEWRPVQIKMRLLPLYDCDVALLLAELAGNDIVREYEHGGKQYGAIRNFCRYQSPDKPRLVYPRADWVDAYTAADSRRVGDRSPTGDGGVADKSDTVLAGKERKGIGEEGNGPDAPPKRADYRWRGQIIRVNAEHYDGWQRSYHALDLPAHLQQLDDFLGSAEATPQQRKGWFHFVSGALRKRHEAALKARVAEVQREDPKTARLNKLRADAEWKRQFNEAAKVAEAEGLVPFTNEHRVRAVAIMRERAQ